jgi:hypothetical protein
MVEGRDGVRGLSHFAIQRSDLPVRRNGKRLAGREYRDVEEVEILGKYSNRG